MEIFIETERLILRHWKEEDRKPFAVMTGNPNVMKYFPSTLSTEESGHCQTSVEKLNG
jgi:ribosomal-protein-alanine N-acetyltransferase